MHVSMYIAIVFESGQDEKHYRLMYIISLYIYGQPLFVRFLIMFICSKSDFYLFNYVTIIKLLNIWILRGRLNRISFRKILERRFWLDRIMGCKFAWNFCFVRLVNFVLFSNLGAWWWILKTMMWSGLSAYRYK